MIAPPAAGRAHPRNGRSRTCEAGVTLVELMISITLGLIVVMAATALFLSAKGSYTAQDEETRLQDTGRYALEILSRSVRQTAFVNWDRSQAPIASTSAGSASIAGLDDRSLKATVSGITSPVTPSVNGSDVLALRFFGAGTGLHGDRTIVNCAGFGIPAAASSDSADTDRGWSIFFVGKDASGESELYCKYRGGADETGEPTWRSESIARGVDSFQVLYGLDSDGDDLPNQFMTASAIEALDNALTLAGDTEEAREKDKNAKTHWKKVTVIRIALLLHGTTSTPGNVTPSEFDLFGKEYSDARATIDPGTRIQEASLPRSSRNRIRRIFTSTIQLRNQSSGGTP
jgi:type IV pilus assembly protein PilW